MIQLYKLYNCAMLRASLAAGWRESYNVGI